jgi:hypothetical protein
MEECLFLTLIYVNFKVTRQSVGGGVARTRRGRKVCDEGQGI